MSESRHMNNRVQDLGNNIVSVECPVEYTDGYHVTCGWSEEDGAWIAKVSGVSTGSILADGPTRELAVLALVTACAATVDAVNDAERLAALTAENERLTENEHTLRMGWWLSHGCSGLYGDDGEMQCGQCMIDFKRDDPRDIETRIKNANMLKLSRAALPSSRETTDEAERS